MSNELTKTESIKKCETCAKELIGNEKEHGCIPCSLDSGLSEVDFKNNLITRLKVENEKLTDNVEHLNDLIHELEQNLLASEDQNHYFKLMGQYRDKAYKIEKKYADLKSSFVDRVKVIEFQLEQKKILETKNKKYESLFLRMQSFFGIDREIFYRDLDGELYPLQINEINEVLDSGKTK
jgi:hypothetical protein